MPKDASGWVEEMLTAITAEPWQGEAPMAPGLGFSEVLGRRVRTGDWQEQKVSTYDKIRQALEAGDFQSAAAFVGFFTDEADVIFGFFRQLIPDANEFLLKRGLTKADLR